MSDIDEVLVSTDDHEIKSICQKFGANVPFLRPEKISRDETGDYDVVSHAISWILKNRKILPKNIIYLRPDFPFRKIKTLDKALNLLEKKKSATGLRSIKESDEIPYKMWKIDNFGYLNPLINTSISDPHNSSRQLFSKTYYPIGYIEIFKPELVLENRSLFSNKIIPFFIPDEKFINVGSIKDLNIAKKLIKNFNPMN